MQDGLVENPDPRPGCIDQRAGAGKIATAANFEDELPDVAAFCPHAPRSGANDGTTLGGIHRIEQDQPSIIGLAIGKFETMAVAAFERRSERVAREVDGAG